MDTDYLVIGAGASSMAFVDELLRNDKRARVVMVDRRATPGGHWNDAYPFVTLHQPALWYGVPSEQLGDGSKDLASKGQILGYYDRVLTKLVRGGRLTFLPQCEMSLPEPGPVRQATIRSLVAPGREWLIKPRVLVDGAWSQIQVPATTPPPFAVQDAEVRPIHELAQLDRPRPHYAVIGAGKTGIDALVYLRRLGVAARDISWVVPRDAWLVNRSALWRAEMIRFFVSVAETVMVADCVDDVFLRMEPSGHFMRVDTTRLPSKYRCATVSEAELRTLRGLPNVIRKGRVTQVTSEGLQLEEGFAPLPAGTLYVNCTADGLAQRPPVPVFRRGWITLQPVAQCQPTFSSAVIGKVETCPRDDDAKNLLTRPLPHPVVPLDMVAALPDSTANSLSWLRNMPLWLGRCRLNPGAHLTATENLRLAYDLLRTMKRASEAAQRLTAS